MINEKLMITLSNQERKDRLVVNKVNPIFI